MGDTMEPMKPVEGEEGLLVPVTDDELTTLVLSILEGEGKPMTGEKITQVVLDLLYVKVEVQIRTMLAKMALAGKFVIDGQGRLRLREEAKQEPETQSEGICVVTAAPGTLLAEMIEESTAERLEEAIPDIRGKQRRCGRCKTFTLDEKCPSCGWPTQVWRGRALSDDHEAA